MKAVSWNVAGLRACINKGFYDFIDAEQPDIICLQETKVQPGQITVQLPGYCQYWNYAERKGYSGTAIFTKKEALNIQLGMGIEEYDTEGRVITLEFDDYYIVTVYTPNSKRDLSRLDYRMDWDIAFLNYINKLDRTKPVIFCGDLNVAHKEIDLKNPHTNRFNPGFTDEEREKFNFILSQGYCDTFRELYPDLTGAYTWWSYRQGVRERNIGWRLDYFVVSLRLKKNIEDSIIYKDVYGSDHCPIGLILKD